MGRINWGRHRDTQKKKKSWKKLEENTEFMGELLKKKGGAEEKQSIPIYKARSLAN